MNYRCIFVMLLALSAAESAEASIINVPADQPTIQAGINAAAKGDTVLVAPGRYTENINFMGKAITVKSSGGAKVTIIDGGGAGSVVTFSSGELRSSVLRGFTITNGHASFGGGGIEISSASPTIAGNVVENNKACDGDGIEVNFGSPMIRGNRIVGNIQSGCSGGTGGGGIEIGGAASAQVIGNLIENNNAGDGDGGGISLFAAGTPTIMNNTLKGNTNVSTGGAISMFNDSDAVVVQNLFIENSSPQGGAVYYLVPSGANGPTLINNTFFGNTASTGMGSAIYANDFNVPSHLYNNIIDGVSGQTAVYCGNLNSSTPPLFFNNDVFASGGTNYGGICSDQTGSNGNISANPLFVKAPANLRLQSGSSAINAGTTSAPDLPSKDLAGKPRIINGTIDIGAYESQ